MTKPGRTAGSILLAEANYDRNANANRLTINPP
jgi:hypothetical protein